MGTALLSGWAAQGIAGSGTIVHEPMPSPDLVAFCSGNGVSLNPPDEPRPAGILVLAVKPQMLDAVVPLIAPLAGPQTLVVSILAGKSIADLSARLPAAQSIVRAMPNTPAAIGRGISGLVASGATTGAQRDVAQRLLEAVGEVVWIPNESLMDAVTAVSGSGPGYLFFFTEALAAAATAAGLPEDLAQRLARVTVQGSGALMAASPDTAPALLRQAVTSPGGTTAAALDVLMGEEGLPGVLRRAVAAAVRRSRELAG